LNHPHNDINFQYATENPFAMSIGDLMAALMMIFVLILVIASSQAQKAEQINQDVTERVEIINTQYKDLKQELYQALADSFPQAKLDDWEAEIDPENLVIRFRNNEVLFATQSSTVRPQFQRILMEFWPTFINVLHDARFRDRIEEVRIEGHTSDTWVGCPTVECRYLRNMQLSQDRTRSVLDYVMTRIPTATDQQDWVRGNVTANGLSYSHMLANLPHERSQRVEFRVRTDAETVLENMIDQILQITSELDG